MTAPLWLALAILVVVAAAILLPRIPPERRTAAAVLAVAAGLAALRAFALAVPVAAFGLTLWRRAAGSPRRDTASAVESRGLRMSLDHATGGIDGEVLSGRFQGRRLSELAAAELQALAAAFDADGDEDSLALLLAYMERRGTARSAEPPPDPGQGPAPMTEAEAYRILGLPQGASLDEVRAAYRRLIKRVHPDLGGSNALASMLNAAKQLLDPS